MIAATSQVVNTNPANIGTHGSTYATFNHITGGLRTSTMITAPDGFSFYITSLCLTLIQSVAGAGAASNASISVYTTAGVGDRTLLATSVWDATAGNKSEVTMNFNIPFKVNQGESVRYLQYNNTYVSCIVTGYFLNNKK